MPPCLMKGDETMKYEVIADFIDSRSGELVKAGETVEATKQEYAHLQRAGVVGEVVKTSAQTPTQGATGEGAGQQGDNQGTTTD